MAVRLSRSMYLAIGLVLTHPRFHPIHRRLYRWTGGRGPVGRALGLDLILITTTGRHSGQPRTIPLAALRDAPRWILIASNAGKDRMPGWAYNLRSTPAVRVEHRGVSGPYHAHEAEGDERAALWSMVTTAYPGYDVYRERTDRPIPLFVLEPVA